MKRTGSIILMFHKFKMGSFHSFQLCLGNSAEHRAGAEKTLKIEYLLKFLYF